MLELLAIIAVIVVIVIAIKMGKQSSKPAKTEKSDDELIADANRLILLMEVKRQAEERGDEDTVNAVLNMTYDGPLPELLPDGSYTSLYEEELSFNIAGINYRKGIAAYVGKFDGYLQPDTQNEYDPNAIAVYHSDGHHLGFIPACETQEVRELNLPFPIAVTCIIEQKHDDAENRDYFQGVVYVEVK